MIKQFYIPFLIIIFLIVWRKKRSVLYDELFWLFFWWTLIIGVYYSGNVDWGSYNVTQNTLLYILLCLALFLLFVYIGEHSKIRSEKILEDEKYIRILNRTRLYTVIGTVGTFVFVADYLRLNGIFAQKSTYSISIIGSIGMVFSPILLVLGLYKIVHSLRNGIKINGNGLLCLIIFNVPSILNSGRETLICTIIGVLAVIAASFTSEKSVKARKAKRFVLIFNKKNAFIVTGILLVLIAAINLIRITTLNRFQLSAVSVFLNSHIVNENIIREANSLGAYSTIYWHILSYFGHQLPYIQFLLSQYKGPYLFGMFELNIISRRLPEILGLNYQDAYITIRSLSGNRFNGSWPTLIGSFIIDFSPFFAPLACAVCGLFLGKSRKKYSIYKDDKYTVLKGLLCFSMTSTIQLGPFYNVAIYGALIWWFIIFRNK